MSQVAVPLEKNAKKAVTIGCVLLMLFIAVSGGALAVLQGPILKNMSEEAYRNYFSLLGIFATLGLSIMTPIGGKLGDIFGRKTIVIIAGIVCAVSSVCMAVIHVVMPFMILRFILGAAQGAFTAVPYVIIREINEPKDVPKGMGLLASAVAIGGMVGSMIAGALSDSGLLAVAIAYPVIFLLIGMALIARFYPNKKAEGKVVIDYAGIVWLTVVLFGLSFALNYGPTMGWTSSFVLILFAVTIVGLGFLIYSETKIGSNAMIPMSLFKNRRYVAILIVTFCCYFYMNAMNSFAPNAVQRILGQSHTVSSSLQFPRMILTMVLPAFFGVWVGKKKDNSWKAMAFACIFVAVAFLPLSFVSTTTSVALYMGMLALTGIAESFRSVSITPAAQAVLSQSEMGVGTSCVTFFNSLSGLVAAAVNAAIYNSFIGGNNEITEINDIISGTNMVNMFSAVLAFIGFLVVIFVVRRQQSTE